MEKLFMSFRVNLKRKKYTQMDFATIIKHRDNMLEMEKNEHGDTKELIQKEIFDCRRFIRAVYRQRRLTFVALLSSGMLTINLL